MYLMRLRRELMKTARQDLDDLDELTSNATYITRRYRT